MAALSSELLKCMRATFLKDAKNVLAQNACVGRDPLEICVKRSALQTTQHVFNVKAKEGKPVTNQKSSGRCWIFACLNAMRTTLMEKWNVEELELSQPYLFFWDKIERSNFFLNAFIETARKKEPVEDRLMSFLLNDPASDGGQWAMLVNLVEKHGVMPKHAMPESASTEASLRMDRTLNNKLREFAFRLRELVLSGKSDAEILQAKNDMMADIYRIVSICLGTPPETFTFEYYDKDKKYHRIPEGSQGVTPLKFYQDHIKPHFNMEDKICIVNDPRPSNPYYHLYTVDYLNNMVGGKPVLYINLPIDKLKQFAAKSIKDGEPVWFGNDVGKLFTRKEGLEDMELLDYENVFGTSILGLDKAQRLIYKESLMTHAMVLSAYGTADGTEEGPITKWRIENSWGEDTGHKGYLLMTDAWFSEFTYEVVVDRKYVDADVLAVLDQEPTILPAWDPMGSLA